MTENVGMMQETSASAEAENIFDDELDEEFDEMLDDLWESDEDEVDEENSEADDSSDADGTADDRQEKETGEQQETSAEEMFPEDVVVYGETKQVTMAQAKDLIQKGLGFDRAKEKWEKALQKANSDPRIAFVEELANAAGVSAVEYMANTRNQMQYADLLGQYGTLDDVPENVMKMFTENAKAAKEKAAGELAREQEARNAQALEAEFDSFMMKHPEIGKIPDGVLQLKVQGESLEGAYGIWLSSQLKAENNKLTQEIKTLKQNIKNKQTSLPSTQSKGSVEDDEDWFE